MSIHRLDKVSCSLNLGLVYSLSYSYSPQDGVSISIFFVNESGEYQRPSLLPMRKVAIVMGSASFSMYPVKWSLTKAAGRRVIKVDFVDEVRELSNYYITLIGRGCGANIFPLGTPVDNRTDAQKTADALDPTAQNIKTLTQFPDLEYSFNDFLVVLRKKFNVQILSNFDKTSRNSYIGTFGEVLRAWLDFYNLSFFFENGILKIFDPTRLVINLPAQPVDAIEYEVEEDISSTYGSTACNYFQQEGGEFALSQTKSDKGALLVRTATLYPIGYDINLIQTNLDLNQVAAAMYGKEFWFLYNKYKGSAATECGWTPLTSVPTTLNTSLITLGFRAAIVDDTMYENKFQAYRTYAESIGGRWYLSDERLTTAVDQGFKWFDETSGQIFTFNDVSDKQINPIYLSPANGNINVIEGTAINQYFQGINYNGNRMAFYDNRKIDFASALSLTPEISALVSTTYQKMFSLPGSASIDFPSDKKYVAYNSFTQIPQDLVSLFNILPDKASLFTPRFPAVPLKGISEADYANQQAAKSENNNVEVVTIKGPTVVGNTSVIKTVKNGTYTAYYDKYSQCASAASPTTYFKHDFNLRQVSTDNQIGFTFTKLSNNTYRIDRDYGVINQLVNNPLLPQIAQPRTFPTKRVSFALNYFYNVPPNFLTSGLVGMDVQVNGDGLIASYSFSNEVLRVPKADRNFDKFEQRIRNSWIRSYRPKETIS